VAVTIAITKRVVAGQKREVYADITGPASYTTGGETLTAAQQAALMPELDPSPVLNFTKVVFFQSEVEPANLRALVLDKTNNKMLFTVAGAQVANATNLSAVVIRCRLDYQVSPIA
jgi:hypothetical protein